ALSTLADRAVTSSSVSRSRYCSWLSLAAAVSRASFSNSACMVGRRSCFKLTFTSKALFAVMGHLFSGKELIEQTQIRQRHAHRTDIWLTLYMSDSGLTLRWRRRRRRAFGQPAGRLGDRRR